MANAIENMMKDTFGPLGIATADGLQLRNDIEDVSCFDEIVLEVVVVAAIRQLGQSIPLRTELFVQIVELQRRGTQRPEQWREHCYLETLDTVNDPVSWRSVCPAEYL